MDNQTTDPAMSSTSETCIAACTDGETTWMGADTATYMGGSYVVQSDKSKIVDHTIHVEQNGSVTTMDCLMGFTGSVRLVNLLRHALDLPRCKRPLREYLVVDLIEEIRSTFKDAGAIDDDNGADTFGGGIVLAVSGGLYQIGSAFDLVPFTDSYAAAGSGQLYALGVLSGAEPGEEAIERALEAAEKHDPYVGAPFDVKTIEHG